MSHLTTYFSILGGKWAGTSLMRGMMTDIFVMPDPDAPDKNMVKDLPFVSSR